MKAKRLSFIVGITAINLLWTSCEESKNKTKEAPTKEKAKVEQQVSNYRELKKVVAIINSDTILSKYEYAIKLRDKLTEQSLKYQDILRKKESKLMSDMQRLQAEAPSLSQFEGQTRQRKLYEEQEKLQIKQEEYSRKLLILEQEYNRDIDYAINEFLSRYCEGKPYELVLSNSELGVIRWVHPDLDITQEVLEGLNKEYQAENTQEGEN